MIKITKGNILQAHTEAIVNTINTVGVMGKGIALQFKETFPQNYHLYREAVDRNEIRIGKMFCTETGRFENPKYIINFPTKAHWKEKSKYEHVESGLDDLIKIIQQKDIQSISIPPLGCGNGGLKWDKVKKILLGKLSILTDIEIVLFEPSKKITYSRMPLLHAQLTEARAMVLELVRQYSVLGYEVTILEIQKLAYFLQRFGEPLRLNYKGDAYGPYAYNLTHLLKYPEGSYIVSKKKIADTKPFDKIELKKEQSYEVTSYVEKNCTIQQKERLQKVARLIQGFESPFGMELLTTVDWVLHHDFKDHYGKDQVVASVHQWNERKRSLMKPEHIKVAIDRLSVFHSDLYTHSEQSTQTILL